MFYQTVKGKPCVFFIKKEPREKKKIYQTTMKERENR